MDYFDPGNFLDDTPPRLLESSTPARMQFAQQTCRLVSATEMEGKSSSVKIFPLLVQFFSIRYVVYLYEVS